LRRQDLKGVSSEIFAGLARYYERTLDLATLYQDRKWKDWVARRVGRGGLVLDLGCGTLVLEERMARTGHRFVGLDLSPEMTRLGAVKRASNVELLANGDAERLPFSDGAFDAAVSCYVPKYVDAQAFAREIARVTKPGANVVLYDFAKPRGLTAPFLQLYIQWGLRAVGWALAASRKRESSTFKNLPWIIEGTHWDVEVPMAMEASGFESLQTERLTGGAVFAYWGRRR
jgi:ubiquinone/menaquinone biosynthesis C-methylase UbiE